MVPNAGVSASLPMWWRKATLLSRIDWLAQANPNGVYAAYPSNPLTYEAGYREITYAQLANAVNGVAHLLENALGRGHDFETLAYIGPNDVRYVAVILGAVKAGYKALLTSPRNSIAAQEHLFNETGCKTILSPAPMPPTVTAILDSLQIRHLEIPGVDELITREYEHYPYIKTYEEAEKDDFAVVHTSGSTGMPKPLVWKHQFVAANIAQLHCEPPTGYESQDRMIQENRVYITFPPFHGAALACLLFNAPSRGTVMITPTSGTIPTGQGLVDALKQTKIDVAFLVPSIVSDLAQSPHLLDFVAQRVQRIFYCGGDLPQAIGDVVAAKLPLYNQYGASEMGLVHQIWASGRDLREWKYIEVHPEVSARLRTVTEDLFEYTIVRKTPDQDQPAAISLFPELDEYGTRDLFVRHPGNPRLWKWQARLDDVIVFLNGEKTNPISFEQHIIVNNSEVARALVTGSQRFQASLLIEPIDNKTALSIAERAALIERVWPSIEEANQTSPAHAKIDKSHILFTTPEKPMMVAGKGTVQRAGTVAMYEKELDKLYADADGMTVTDLTADAMVFEFNDNESVSRFIESTVSQVTGMKSLGLDDNFFTLGMDSLQALLVLRKLKHGLRLDGLTLSTVYTNPSVASLSEAIVRLAHLASESQDLRLQRVSEEMQKLLEKYQGQIDGLESSVINGASINGVSVDGSNKGYCVLITGSTGTLGCYLLHKLLSNADVTAVYCLNRAKDGGKSLQASRLTARGLDGSLASDPRVSFHYIDISRKSLGLDDVTMKNLRSSVTHIIHAAWTVDFNLPLDAFEPHIMGVVNMLALAASSSRKVTMMFVSSISSVMSYRERHGTVPEAVVSDVTAAAPTGYSQSKLLAELLLAYAAPKLCKGHVDLAIARVGQVAGAASDPVAPDKTKRVVTWNVNEWFPSLILSSAHIGALPDRLGSMSRIDWMPIDHLSSVLIELMLASTSTAKSSGGVVINDSEVRVYHPYSPKPVDWPFIRQAVMQEIESQTKKSPEVIPLDAWLHRVQKSLETGAVENQSVGKVKPIKDSDLDEDLNELLRVNPAAKLLGWYRDALGSRGPAGRGADGLVEQEQEMETVKTYARSPVLREHGGLKGSWVRRWVGEWLATVL